MDFKGTLNGKQVFVTTDARPTSDDELRGYLSRFNLAWLLRRIGELSTALAGESLVIAEGIPIPAHCLPYLALVAIESANDAATTVPSVKDLAQAARIFNGLDEPSATTRSGVVETLLPMGHKQFSSPDAHNAIARTWLLYAHVWKRCSRAASLDIDASILRETGLTVTQLMVLGLAYAGRSRAGYWSPYTDGALTLLPAELGVEERAQTRFLRWIAASYSEIRELSGNEVSARKHGTRRFNPLKLKPVVRPELPPEKGAEQVHLVPVPSYVIAKITDGLYHALATSHREGGSANAFRSAFGHVFQEYVGELLRKGSGTSADVVPEWAYGRKGEQRDTPDWLVVDREGVVVVEVKQSALTLNTKMLGDPAMIRDDLARTLAQGARQVLRFKDDVLARVPGLERIADRTEFELVIVTHDSIPWANWLLREEIAKDLSNAHEVHLLSIDDFENLQRYCWGESPFGLLRSKRLGANDDKYMDFREWLAGLGEPRTTEGHPFLAAAFSDLTRWSPRD